MAEWRLTTPVVLIVFNRPDTTARVFSAIAAAKPPALFVIGDGARAARIGEAQAVAAARAIATRVDWDCDLRTAFSDENLGCKRRVSSGLDWVFQQAERAIVLEDDCVPHPTFFRFAEELLEKYAGDERVFTVSGDNFQAGRPSPQHSYYFSKYVHVWGWATWRRSWQRCDPALSEWPALRRAGWLDGVLGSRAEVRYWTRAFDDVHAGRLDSWAHAMTFACWRAGAVNALPSVNLVSNIGFGAAATHTSAPSPYAALPVEAVAFPLRHPPHLSRNVEADLHTHHAVLSPPLFGRIASRLKHALRAGRA